MLAAIVSVIRRSGNEGEVGPLFRDYHRALTSHQCTTTNTILSTLNLFLKAHFQFCRFIEMANVSSAIRDIEKSTDSAMDVDKATETLLLPATSLQENSTKVEDGCSDPNLFERPNTRFNTPPLPLEILFSILPRAIPPFALLDTTKSPGENSAWCQTLRLMQSIVLVCSGWYDAGIIFLYENVCIRRYRQLESLRWTLTSSPAKNFSLLVKSLTIQCCIPEDKTFDFQVDLEAVVGSCTSMSTFASNAIFDSPVHSMTIRFPAYITHLRLGREFDYVEVFAILMQLKETLTSFHFMISLWDDNFEQTATLWERLHLPSLQALSVTMDRSKFPVWNILQSHLTMPSLQRFTVEEYYYGTFDSGGTLHDSAPQIATIIRFLELHGSQLRQLRIGFRSKMTPKTFKQVLSLCPQLERIILHPSMLPSAQWISCDLLHPKLRWVDFTHFLFEIYDYPSSELCLSRVNLPALERIRRFCDFPGWLIKWLDEYPPNAVAETEEFVTGLSWKGAVCLGEYWRFRFGDYFGGWKFFGQRLSTAFFR